MKLKNKSGFTLLEIIIVIIIVGVLASLALPKFFSTVEFSRSTEALSVLSAARKSIERCFLMSNDYTGCDGAGFVDVDMDDPDNNTGTHFTYLISGATATGGYTITAYRNTFDGGTAGDSVAVAVDHGAGTVTRSGTGAFLAIK